MKKALFLDRDGVINKTVKKFSKEKRRFIDDSPFNVFEFKFNKNIKNIVMKAKKKKYEVIIITNQPSILKGNFTMKDYEKINTKICKFLGIKREKIFECFHKENLSLPCNCRKPKPGLFLMAKGEFNIDLKNSLLIGDSWRDIIAGQKAGIKKTIFIRRKKDEFQIGNLEDEKKMIKKEIKPSKIINSLEEAILFLNF